jgi:glycopeptide antibiotics resistance protein
MVDTYVLPIRTAALVFPLLALLLLMPVAIAMYRRHGVMRWRALSFFGFLYFALTAFLLVIMPLPAESLNVCREYPTMAHPQLIPGNTVNDFWKEAGNSFTLDAFVLGNPAVWKTAFNLLLLVPLGIFLRYQFKRGFWASAALACGASLFFELTQLTGVWGIYACPYRLFDVDDLIINTAGAMIGWALCGRLAQRLPDLDALDDRVLARHPVPFGRRLTALLLDLTGVAFAAAIAVLFLVLVDFGRVDSMFWGPLLAVLGWFVVLPGLTGATPGKHVLLLKLVTRDGNRPAAWRLLVRTTVLGLPLLPVVTPLSQKAADVLGSSFAPARLLAKARRVNPGSVDDSLVLTVVLAVSVGCILLAGYALAVRLHPKSLGIHELASGLRNQALPHKRAGDTTAAPEGSTPVPPARGVGLAGDRAEGSGLASVEAVERDGGGFVGG